MANLTVPYRTPILVPYLRKRWEREKKAVAYSAPSNMPNLCPRAYYYAMHVDRTYTQKFSGLLHITLGAWAEDYLETIFNQIKIPILGKEIKFEPDPEDLIGLDVASGRIDFLIQLGTERYFVEVKKMNPRRFNTFKTAGLRYETAAHFQILYYMYNWHKAIKQGASLPKIEGSILVGIMPDPDITDTFVEYREEDYKSFLPKLQILEQLKQTKNDEAFGPPARPEKNTWDSPFCISCPFYDICYNDQNYIIENGQLTDNERKILNDIMIDLARTKQMQEDARVIGSTVRSTLIGFMQSKDAHTIFFKSTLGEMVAELNWSHETRLDSEKVREAEPELYNKLATKISKLDIKPKIDLAPAMRKMIRGELPSTKELADVGLQNNNNDPEQKIHKG